MKRNDNNLRLRFLIESNGLEYGTVAEKVGIGKSNLSKWMRTELDGVRKMRVEAAVNELIKEKGS